MVGVGTSKAGDLTGNNNGRILLGDTALQRNMDGISRVFFGEEEEGALGPQQ